MRPRYGKTKIEKTYETVGIEENKKTIFATYVLKREFNYWWEAKHVQEEFSLIS